MDSKNIVPNLFFDLIARVVPGCVLLFGVHLAIQRDIVQDLIKTFIPSLLQNAVTPWLVVVLGSSYVLGHLMSPIVRFLEKEKKENGNGQKEENVKREKSANRPLLAFIFPFWSHGSVIQLAEDYHETYNWLRFHHPNAAALAIRIRAEYTMYGGIAVAITLSLITFLLRVVLQYGPIGVFRILMRNPVRAEVAWVAIAVLAIPAMLRRQYSTKCHFKWTLDDFLKAAANSQGPEVKK